LLCSAPPLTGALCIALLLQACAGSLTDRELDKLPIAPAAELTDTPFYPQEVYQCGPAALATVVGQAGVDVSPETLQPLVYLPGRKGSLQFEMLAVPARYDLLGVQVRPSLRALLELVSSGYPVLVLQNLGFESLPVWHYAVVVGYDLGQRRILLRSGLEQRVSFPFGRFEKTWVRANRWAMVVVPPGEIPPAVEPLAYIQAVNVLERLERYQFAHQAYTKAARYWPDKALAWAGAGNSAFAMGMYADADTAYRQALVLEPDNALLLNNLAAALGEQGCRAEALAVIECALLRWPDNRILEATLQEIRQSAARSTACQKFICPGSTP
jgi:TPR repeat/Peptidase_C39 like family